MERPLIFLMMVVGILAAGIILSFYGAQLTTQDIIVKEESIVPGNTVELSTELDPEISETGVYAVLLEKYEEEAISISVYDPFDSEIISSIAEKESNEERFEIVSSGTYKLEIENSGLEDAKIVAGLGYMPDSSTLSVGITGFFLLIVGLVGIVGIGFYAVRNRQKHRLN